MYAQVCMILQLWQFSVTGIDRCIHAMLSSDYHFWSTNSGGWKQPIQDELFQGGVHSARKLPVTLQYAPNRRMSIPPTQRSYHVSRW